MLLDLVCRADAGDGDIAQIVILLIFVLISVVAGLAKKASQASKRGAFGGRQPGPRPTVQTPPESRVPSLSDFLRRIKEMSQGGEGTGLPRQGGPEPPKPPAAVPVPPGPRRPAAAPKPMARPVTVRQPTSRQSQWAEGARAEKPPSGLEREIVRTLERAPGERREAETLAGLEVALEKPPALGIPSPDVAGPVLAGKPTPEVHAVAPQAPVWSAHMLGEHVSAPDLRKGIVLSEILGRPRALRRGVRGARRVPPQK